ncbi:MAG: LolA family protein [Ignavibacteria bacterium]|jgi:outer membrane lipoprotein-sorting protein
MIYTNLTSFLIACVISLMQLSIVNAQNSKDEVFAQLRKKYGSMQALEVSFSSLEPVSGIKGTLKALRSGKYHLTVSDRTIVCDGNSIWNYVPARKNVTINSVKSRPSTSLDIVLFTFLYNYQPKALQEFTIGNSIYHGLELIPKSGKTAMGIKSLTLFVKKGGFEIKRIQAVEGNQTLIWDIQSLKINTSLRESLFTFSPPKDTEILDLR